MGPTVTAQTQALRVQFMSQRRGRETPVDSRCQMRPGRRLNAPALLEHCQGYWRRHPYRVDLGVVTRRRRDKIAHNKAGVLRRGTGGMRIF